VGFTFHAAAGTACDGPTSPPCVDQWTASGLTLKCQMTARREPGLANLKQGRTFAPNGPLLAFRLDSERSAMTCGLPAGSQEVKFSAWLRSMYRGSSRDHLHGLNRKTSETHGNRDTIDAEGTLPTRTSGWLSARASNDRAVIRAGHYPYAQPVRLYRVEPRASQR